MQQRTSPDTYTTISAPQGNKPSVMPVPALCDASGKCPVHNRQRPGRVRAWGCNKKPFLGCPPGASLLQRPRVDSTEHMIRKQWPASQFVWGTNQARPARQHSSCWAQVDSSLLHQRCAAHAKRGVCPARWGQLAAPSQCSTCSMSSADALPALQGNRTRTGYPPPSMMCSRQF